MDFDWDPAKAAKNLKNHKVSSNEAKSVFDDPLAGYFEDEEHSELEERELVIGYSNQARLLMVWFTERENGIRLITARVATAVERKDYENNQ